MIEFVAGFRFDSSRHLFVALIEKKRPIWQAGSFNAIGGHIEEGETVREAMAREFREETGVWTPALEWTETVILEVNGRAVVHFCQSEGSLDDVRSMTDEEVKVFHTSALPAAIMPNLRWLIPMQAERIYWPVRMVTTEDYIKGGYDARGGE